MFYFHYDMMMIVIFDLHSDENSIKHRKQYDNHQLEIHIILTN